MWVEGGEYKCAERRAHCSSTMDLADTMCVCVCVCVQ